MLTAIQSSALYPAVFVQLTFQSGPVYIWSGLGTVNWNGQNWIGVGALGGVSAIEEGSSVEAKGVTLTLSGFDSTLLPDVMGEFALLLPVTIYFGAFNSGVLIDNPIASFVGQMDQPMVEINGETATISINCESALIALNEATDRRYTNDDQQRDWPGDLGMSYVMSIQEISLQWGQQTNVTSNI